MVEILKSVLLSFVTEALVPQISLNTQLSKWAVVFFIVFYCATVSNQELRMHAKLRVSWVIGAETPKLKDSKSQKGRQPSPRFKTRINSNRFLYFLEFVVVYNNIYVVYCNLYGL